MAKRIETMTAPELVKLIVDNGYSRLSASALKAQRRADLVKIVKKEQSA